MKGRHPSINVKFILPLSAERENFDVVVRDKTMKPRACTSETNAPFNMSVTYTQMWLGAPNGDPVIDFRVSSQNKAFVTGTNYHALTSHEPCAWSETMRSGQRRVASIQKEYIRDHRHIAS